VRSFTDASFRAVYSLFTDLVRVNNQRTRPELVAREIANAEVVVYEVAERYIVSGYSAIISNRELGLIQTALAAAR
jgi:hypothetical protein